MILLLCLLYFCYEPPKFLSCYLCRQTRRSLQSIFSKPYQTPHITIVGVAYEPKQHVYYLIKLSISKRNLLAIYFQGQDSWKEKIIYRKVSIVGFNITFLSRSNADNFIWSIASHTNWFSFINAIWQIWFYNAQK